MHTKAIKTGLVGMAAMAATLTMSTAASPADAARSATAAQADVNAGESAAAQCHQNRAYTFRGAGVFLNVEGGSRKGSRIITWPWAGGAGNEQWCLTPGPRGYGWNLRPWDARSLCMDVPRAKYEEGQGLIVWDCNGQKNQDFYVHPVCTEGGNCFIVLGPWEKSNLKIHRSDPVGGPVSLWGHHNSNSMWT